METRTPQKRSRLWAMGLVLFAAIGLMGSTASAGEEKVVVEEVEIQGLERTKRYVVEREFAFQVGQPARMEDIDRTQRRLRNLPMFDRVDLELSFVDKGEAALHIDVDEQWTLLPTANFRATDDVRLFRVGARDVNILGHFLEAGAVYERLSGVHSAEGWFRNPRLFNRRLDFGVEGAYRNRIFTLYDVEGDVEGGFLRRRIAAEVDAQEEIRDWLRAGGRLEVTDDVARLEEVGDEIRQVQAEEDLPVSTTLIRPGVTAQLGRIDDDGFLSQGVAWEIRLDGASKHLGSTESFVALDSEVNIARTLPLRSLFMARASGGATGAQAEYHRLFVGGLDEVRGFRDLRFRGNYRWFANLEYRIPSIDTEWVVLQHAAFFDIASLGDDLSGLGTVDALSVGAGVRLKSPQIHDLVVRIDYAISLYGDGRAPLSFGGNQFF